MVSLQTFRQLSLSYPDTTEEPHFEKSSYRIKKKIFATLDQKKKIACVKLSETDQDVFCLIDKEIIYPVPNKWGKQGWTLIDLTKIKKPLLTDVLSTAYNEVAKKR